MISALNIPANLRFLKHFLELDFYGIRFVFMVAPMEVATRLTFYRGIIVRFPIETTTSLRRWRSMMKLQIS